MTDSSVSAAASVSIRVDVAYADPQVQIVRHAAVASDATAEEAIRASGIRALLPDGFVPAAIGIFGRVVAADAPLRDGDRIELYRSLKIDPRQARRRRAEGTRKTCGA
jgi:putative ubiquitin-RnfH superfamily antitoxin RatB of RatAB toxin-antitoxin module